MKNHSTQLKVRAVNYLCCFLLSVIMTLPEVCAQDSLSSTSRKKLHDFLDNFDVSVYIDVYSNLKLNSPTGDTSNLVEFASNCPFAEEFRLNVASLWLYYAAKNIRGKLELQWGDAPNLLASPQVQFIKNMKQANFGFRIYKTLWIDFGYLYNPIGYESSWPIRNQLSTVTTGGYFETGNFLCVKLSSQISPSFYAGIYIGNPYTLAYGLNKRIYAGMAILYSFKDVFAVNYNNMIGDASLVNSEMRRFYMYNNLIVKVTPMKNFLIVGEIDFGMIDHSAIPPDTMNPAYGLSGFLQVNYRFVKWFAATIRGEYFNDPDGATGKKYTYNGKTRRLLTYGGTFGIEFKPVPYSYIRAEYTYLSADKGNKIFNSNLTDDRHMLTFTVGLRYGTFR